jgi:hypothetical protein
LSLASSGPRITPQQNQVSNKHTCHWGGRMERKDSGNGGVCKCNRKHQDNLKKHVHMNMHKKQMLCMFPPVFVCVCNV